MSSTLIIAIAIPWVFWGILMGLLAAAGRSWINLLLIPVGITIVLLIAASITTAREVFWASLTLHLFFLVSLLVSYAAFVLRERKEKQ